jgi:hypothetical protein
MDEVPVNPSDEEREWNSTINRLITDRMNTTELFDIINQTTTSVPDDLDEDGESGVQEEYEDEVEEDEDEGTKDETEGPATPTSTTSTSTTTTPRPHVVSTKRPMVTSTTPSSTSTSTKRPNRDSTTSTTSTTTKRPRTSTTTHSTSNFTPITTTEHPGVHCKPCLPCPTVKPPVDCDPGLSGNAAPAMSVPVAVVVGAVGSLLAMALVGVAGLILRYAPVFVSGSLFVGTIIIVWYLCSKYPAVARDLGTRVIELAREATHSLADRVLGALRSQREVIQISGRGHV